MTTLQTINSHLQITYLVLTIILIQFIVSEAQTHTNLVKVQALFVFGDSTVDSGNNNYFATLYKSNFPPYGRDFPNHIPTGRFTDGRLVTDYIGSYLGVKDYFPPYLDPTLSLKELLTGVSFASAGGGFDPSTPQQNGVLSMSKQMDYFRAYRARLEHVVGKKKVASVIKNAAFIVSAGTNDFTRNYKTTSTNHTVSTYQNFVLDQAHQFIQDLLNQGARLIYMVGVPPIGCLPSTITQNSENPLLKRSCIESYSSVARGYNKMLQHKLDSMQNYLATQGVLIRYIDIYRPLEDIIQRGYKYGFENVNKGCCGTGLFEAGPLCNPLTLVCPDASKHVFFDSVHPTEKTYSIIFQSIKSVLNLM